MSYQVVPIGEVVTLRQGFAINKHTKHHMSDEPTSLYLLRIGDMKEKSFNTYVKDTIPSHFIAKESDIIYTRTGQVGLVFKNQYGVIHNNCFTVTPIDDHLLDREFLYYVLSSPEFYQEANSKATGAAQLDLSHAAFLSINIPLPKYHKFVANMSNEELEKWYDETYQLCLLCFLEMDNVERKRKIKELNEKIKTADQSA